MLPWILALAAVALWVALSPPGANDIGGDEGYYGTQARNILADARQLVSPSITPGGGPGDKPPAYAALLALSIRVAGPTEVALRWPSLLCTVVAALCVARLAALAAGAWAGVAAAALFVALPIVANFSRFAAAEHPLTALGACSLACLAGGPTRVRRALAAGALLGLAFLCKLWLTLLVALPAVALLLPPERGAGRWARPLAALVLSAVAVGLLQLAAVAVLAPGDLAHWWSVYWIFSLASRFRAEDYADYWIQPPAFYWTTLAHAFVLALPLAALGFEWALRRLREPVPRALLVWALSPVLLSVFPVKTGAYLYPAVPAWAALAALGLVSLARGEARPRVVFALFAAASAPPLARALGGPAPPLTAWLAAWTAAGLALGGAALQPAWRTRLAVTLGAAVAIAGLAREVQRLSPRHHDPGYRFVARALTLLLARAERSRPAFVAPEAPSFAYYLDRAGQYWATPYIPWSRERFDQIRADTALRAFVVDPAQSFYGGWPDSVALGWLETDAREITRDIETSAGRRIAVRVFTREAPAPGATP